MEETLNIIGNFGVLTVLAGIVIWALYMVVKNLPTIIKALEKLGDAMEAQSKSNQDLSTVLGETSKKHDAMDKTLSHILDRVDNLSKSAINQSDIDIIKDMLIRMGGKNERE